VIVLAVLFVWLFLPPGQPSRHLVMVSTWGTWGTDRLAAAPIAYETEDAALLGTLSAFQATHQMEAERLGGGLAGMRGRLKELSRGDDGVLMLYICANGYSEHGRAYLGMDGRAEIGELLDCFDGSGAGLKLLAIDYGRIDGDVPRGMAVNEFSRLVEEELRRRKDQNLWVLLANSPLERSHASHQLEQGVFAAALAEALSGAADKPPLGDGNSMVDLDELYRFALWRCRRWFPRESAITQTPLLIKAGVGLVQPGDIPTDDSCRLVPVQDDWLQKLEQTAAKQARAAKKPKAPAAMTAIGRSAAAATPNAAPPAKSDASAESAAPGAVSAAAEANKDAASPAPTGSEQPAASNAGGAESAGKAQPGDGQSDEALVAALYQAWLLRDRLESRADDLAGRSPVDFAPHLWQETLAWLVFLEQSSRAGKGAPGAEGANLHQELTARTRELSGDLEALLNAMSGGAQRQTARSSVGRRLLEAWETYSQSLLQVESQHHSLNQRAEHARRQFNDAAQRAPWYVRWHRTAVTTGAVDAEQTRQLAALLTTLAAEEVLLAELHGNRRPEEVEPQLAQFERLDGLRREIDRLLVAEAQRIRLHVHRADYQQRAEDLLATPLLGAEARRGLIAELLAASTPSLPDRPPTETEIRQAMEKTGIAVAPARWLRLRDHAELEMLLVRWARPEAAGPLESLVASLPGQIDALDPALRDADRPVWQTFGQIGQELGAFYRDLPEGLPQRSAAELAQSSRCRAALCLIDPRVAANFELPALPAVPLTIVLPAELQVFGPSEIALLESSPVDVEIQVRASDKRLLGSGLQWSVEFDEAWLDVRKIAESPAQPDGDGYSKRVSWSIAARRVAAAGGARTAPIAFTASWRDDQVDALARHRVAAALPLPNRIDLVFARSGDDSPEVTAATIARWALDANRTSRFKLSLANKSGRPQSVRAALYAVPAVPGVNVAPGRITPEMREQVWNASTHSFRLVPRLLAQTAESVLLSASSRATPIVLAPPASAAPAAPAPAEAGGAAANDKASAPAAPSFEAADVSRGLVLVVTADSGAPPWVKWIELAPRHPREFLEVEAGLDVKANQLVAIVRPRNSAAGRFGFPEHAPVLVEWDTAGEALVQDGAKQFAGVLAIKDKLVTPPELKLFATVPAEASQWTVRLSVNGYPRAFTFDVRRPDAREKAAWASGISASRTARQVRITSLAMENEAQVFHLPPYATVPPEKKPEAGAAATPIAHLRQPENEAIVFPDTGRPLTLTLAADAPVDAFQDRTGDRLLVWLGDDPDVKTELLADRHFSAVLSGVSPEGELVFAAGVRDHAVSLKSLGRSNVVTYVKAQLEVPGESTVTDVVRVQFDGDTPRAKLPPTIKVVQGAPLKAALAVQDQSGIKRIRYALLPTDAAEIPAEAAKEMEVRIASGEREIPLSLATDELAPKEWKLFVETMDLTGRWSEPTVSRVTVIDPASLPGYVKGAIRYGGTAPVRGVLFKLFIQGDAIGVKRIEKLSSDGSFEYGPLPPGRYTITAEGSYRNTFVSGKLEGAVPAQREQLQAVIIPVMEKKPEK
jgi:hypothetical protein